MASGAKKSHKIVLLWNLVTINDSDLHKWHQDNYLIDLKSTEYLGLPYFVIVQVISQILWHFIFDSFLLV